MDSEFNFVIAPPQDRFCPVCTELLTEPFLSDCGHHVCRECRGRIMASGKTECPTCRGPNLLSDARLNKHLQREIYDLKVHCKHHEAGCQWVGELRDLTDHLDLVRRNCEYLLLPCSFGCGQRVRRRAMKHHKLHECPKRNHTCEYCNYHDSRDIVMKQHLPVCHEFPVKCPNKCNVEGLKRKQLKAHIDECPLQVIKCPFSSAGCTVKLPRNQMETHEDIAMHQHLRLVMNELKLLKNELKQEPLPSPSTATCPQYLYTLPPVVFTVTDFQRKKQANEVWTSPPIYTHIGGYKFGLRVCTNDDGDEGTHVSAYAFLMRGECDDKLEWPFEGSFTVNLLNQKEDKNHCSKILKFNRYTDENGIITSRVIDKKENEIGFGIEFISHTDLSYNPTINTEYLQDDCLRLRVSDVVVYSTALLHKTPSWQDPLTTTQSVCEFTLTEFSKRKQFNNRYYSPPFYTHPQGYKLCLKVYANGYGSGEGTHVSIFATLMKGEHDQHLQWPFTGDIIIELLNWREDKEHHKKSLEIVESHGFIQVTKGTYGNNIGYDQFVSHSSLPYNSTTNTEYLQDDCLRLRVNVTNINTR